MLPQFRTIARPWNSFSWLRTFRIRLLIGYFFFSATVTSTKCASVFPMLHMPLNRNPYQRQSTLDTKYGSANVILALALTLPSNWCRRLTSELDELEMARDVATIPPPYWQHPNQQAPPA